MVGIKTREYFVENKHYRDVLEDFLINTFLPAGYKITKQIELDAGHESSKYEALVFALDERSIVYRKAKVTADRPGAFLSLWQRPSSASINGNKPIPLTTNELDYLFVKVKPHASANEELAHSIKCGLFIFPVALLIEKGIISSTNNKGKLGFRVFPPWSQDRGIVGTKVFSESGKKTQRWQLPYFFEIDENGIIDVRELDKLLSHKIR